MPVRVADPPVTGTGAPRLAPSMPHCRVPPMGPAEVPEVIWAVKSTDCPKTDGLTDEGIPVVVGALLTTWPSAGVLVAPLKLPSPAYTAVMGCEPTASALMVIDAT